MKFDMTNARVSKTQFERVFEKLKPEIGRMQKVVRDDGYDDARSSVNCCSDTAVLREVNALVKKKAVLKPEYVIVIGIGGSNLGTIAVQEAVLGKQYNLLAEGGPRVLYADTVDADSIATIIDLIEPTLKKGGNVLLNVISKSGGTTETMTNFEALVSVVAHYKKNYQDLVVVTTNKGGKFGDYARLQGFDVLPMPLSVGGRYSVFSTVGLFPLGMIGIDLSKLLKGARDVREVCVKKAKTNPAVQSAISLFVHHKKGVAIHDTFLFSNDLESIGKWYRQLMGESIGKKYNVARKRVFNGMTPTVSIGSTDLHSMAQLYLGGPYDKITTFVEVKQNNCEIVLGDDPNIDALVPHIQQKPMSEIMDAILTGIQTAFVKGKRPFNRVLLSDKSEYEIGGLLQFKMIEMMYLGELMGVNPFDQPNVEDYKIVTKKVLARE